MDPTLLDDDEDLKEFERVQKEDQPEDTCLDNEGPATFIFRRPPDELDEDDVEGNLGLNALVLWSNPSDHS